MTGSEEISLLTSAGDIFEPLIYVNLILPSFRLARMALG